MSYFSEVWSDNPVAWYRFQEASGNPQDSSGKGNHVTTVFGSPTYRNPTPIRSDPSDYSVLLNGTSFFRAPANSSMNVGDVCTMECWAARTNPTDASLEVLMALFPDGLSLSFLSTGFACGKSNVGFLRHQPSDPDDTNRHHYVVTKSGSSVLMYIDGEQISTTFDNDLTLANGGSFDIGHESGSFGFQGMLDEVALYGTALSASRISAHYLAGLGDAGVRFRPRQRTSRGVSWS